MPNTLQSYHLAPFRPGSSSSRAPRNPFPRIHGPWSVTSITTPFRLSKARSSILSPEWMDIGVFSRRSQITEKRRSPPRRAVSTGQ